MAVLGVEAVPHKDGYESSILSTATIMQKVLGVDIGGVIINRQNDRADTSFFGDNFLLTPEEPDALSSLRLLNAEVGGEPFTHIYTISKCGETVQEKSHKWLDAHKFDIFAGITTNRRLFCRKRFEKAAIAEKFAVTHFVDDRLDVLNHMIGIVPYLYLYNPNEQDLECFMIQMSDLNEIDQPIKLVNSWKTLTKMLKE